MGWRIPLKLLRTKRISNGAAKEMLVKEFGHEIGPHKHIHVNEYTIVYNTSGGKDFIEATINTWGIDTEKLIWSTGKRLHKMFHDQISFPVD